jgi:hypothetical protein
MRLALIRFPKLGQTRLVEGPLPPGKIYDQGLKAQGHWGGGHEGLPRFREVLNFKGEYPFGMLQLADPDLPLRVEITGFNPFIPLDVKNSAIPCAILEYQLENISNEAIDYEFSYHLSHLAPGANPKEASTSRNRAIPGRGVYFYNEEDPFSAEFGSACLAVVGFEPRIKTMVRGGWVDGLSALWRKYQWEFVPTRGAMKLKGRNGARSFRAIWRQAEDHHPDHDHLAFPNVHFSSGIEQENLVEAGSKWERLALGMLPRWPTMSQLRTRCAAHAGFPLRFSQHFRNLYWRLSANLAIIKSPTVLLQENGHLWGWEGCFPDRGCCPGACTHVWNYAQSIPHLFPQLERSLRELELERSMDERGHVAFRSALPDSPRHNFRGSRWQLGGV